MDLVKILSERYMKPELPEMNVGDRPPHLLRCRLREGLPGSLSLDCLRYHCPQG